MRKRTVASLRSDARAILPSVQLSQVYVVDAHVRTHDRSQSPPFVPETNVQVKCEAVTDHLEVAAKYSTTVYTESLDDTEPVLVWAIDIECAADFELVEGSVVSVEDFSADEREAFALLVGAPAIHPYAREWTQLFSSQTMYPALTIGLMHGMAELGDDEEIDFPDRDTPEGDAATS